MGAKKIDMQAHAGRLSNETGHRFRVLPVSACPDLADDSLPALLNCKGATLITLDGVGGISKRVSCFRLVQGCLSEAETSWA